MSVPGVTFGLADGRQAVEREDREEDLEEEREEEREEELLTLAGESSQPAADLTELARRLRVWRRQPGFALAEARHGGYLVGYAMGMPLRPATSWWKDVTSPLPAGLTEEHPGRTFAVTALLVRAAWRRQGIGAGLHRLLLSGRPEERATLTVAPSATAAQRALRAWGWTKVARTRTAAGEVEDIFLISPIPNVPS